MMTDSSVVIRPLFREGYYKLCKALSSKETKVKYLAQAFCGCGKSRFAYKSMLYAINNGNKNILMVCPTIALITQFNMDYISKDIDTGMFQTMSVCSKKELQESEYPEIKYTTNKADIKKFVNTDLPKIICCTYQSLGTFVNSLGETKMDFAIFDEAHRTESDSNESLIHGDNPFFRVGLFPTATPSSKMKTSMERICHIPYFDAQEAGYVKEIELRIDIDKKVPDGDQKFGIYKSIARAVLVTGNNKIMSFHSFSNDTNNEQPTSVISFVDEKEFKRAFDFVMTREFPQLRKIFKNHNERYSSMYKKEERYSR